MGVVGVNSKKLVMVCEEDGVKTTLFSGMPHYV